MLIGKTLVITGISSGIGARVGELAVALGADIVGVDLNPPAKPMDAFIQADVGSSQGVEEIVQSLPRRIDALCNVAGVSGLIGAPRTLAINFYGLRALSEAVAPRLREGEGSSMSLRSPDMDGGPILSGRRLSWRRKDFPTSAHFWPRTKSLTRKPILCQKSFCCCGRCRLRIDRYSRIGGCASTP